MPGELNYDPSGWPVAPETKVFRAVENVFRSDPRLPGFVQTWSTWRGEDIDMLLFPDDINHVLCPFLRISPFPIQADQATEIEHQSDLQVRVELAVATTNTDVIMSFWELLRRAVWPLNNTMLRDSVMSRIQLAGGARGVYSLPAYSAVVDAEKIPILVAQGFFRFRMLIQ